MTTLKKAQIYFDLVFASEEHEALLEYFSFFQSNPTFIEVT